MTRMLGMLAIVACLGPSTPALAGDDMPLLVVDGELQIDPGVAVTAPFYFTAADLPVVAIAFSLDLDLDSLVFDPADNDGDGVPDAVSFPLGGAAVTAVDFDATDDDGELDVLLANLSGPLLPEGLFMEIELLPAATGWVSTWLRFSGSPEPSFGDDQGQAVPGSAVVLGPLFTDGFESGDLTGWSGAAP